jgi:hypothetical protein
VRPLDPQRRQVLVVRIQDQSEAGRSGPVSATALGVGDDQAGQLESAGPPAKQAGERALSRPGQALAGPQGRPQAPAKRLIPAQEGGPAGPFLRRKVCVQQFPAGIQEQVQAVEPERQAAPVEVLDTADQLEDCVNSWPGPVRTGGAQGQDGQRSGQQQESGLGWGWQADGLGRWGEAGWAEIGSL